MAAPGRAASHTHTEALARACPFRAARSKTPAPQGLYSQALPAPALFGRRAHGCLLPASVFASRPCNRHSQHTTQGGRLTPAAQAVEKERAFNKGEALWQGLKHPNVRFCKAYEAACEQPEGL